MEEKLPSTKILGTTITTASKEEILEYIFKRLKFKTEKFYIVTPNPEMVMHASRSKEFSDILNSATVSLPDGVGVLIAGKILKKRIIGRITGVDMMEEMCRYASRNAVTVGFLGGKDGVAEKTAECLVKKYPGLRVVFAASEWVAKNTEYGMSNIEAKKQNSKFKIQNSNSSHIDILFVAFGFPKQEEWIAKNLPNIDVSCAMGVGGAFDFISGKVLRAPKLVQSAGLEWAFRLVRQPWRIKRQLALPMFVTAVLKKKFNKTK